jgi:hypothetical protein
VAALTGRVGKLLRANADVTRTLLPTNGAGIGGVGSVIRLMNGVGDLYDLAMKNSDLVVVFGNAFEADG